MADKAKVLERNNTAYVIGAHLKVMLEEDYLALKKHETPNLWKAQYAGLLKSSAKSSSLNSNEEVNQGTEFCSIAPDVLFHDFSFMV